MKMIIFLLQTSENHRIQKLNKDGVFLASFGKFDLEEMENLSHPSGIDIDSKGNVYITDERNYRVQIFSPVTS